MGTMTRTLGRKGRFIRRLPALIVLALLTSACRDEAPSPPSRSVAAPDTSPGIADSDWLAANDPTPPERWLLAHRLAANSSDGAADETALAALLTDASRRFQENPRMIANRAFQLQGMLADAGMAEDAVDLVRRFLTLPERPELRGFSANCQHYFNLRQQGLDPTQALATLAKG